MLILQVDVAILSKTLADYILGITVSFCLRYTEHVNNKVLTGSTHCSNNKVTIINR